MFHNVLSTLINSLSAHMFDQMIYLIFLEIIYYGSFAHVSFSFHYFN